MTWDLAAVCFDAHDPARLAGFWSALLGWPAVAEGEDVALVPGDGTGYRLRLVASREPKSAPNRIHLDLTSSSDEDQQQTVAQAVALGGRHLEVDLGPDERHVPLADPEGNELCVIPADNRFLAGCGRVGAINCEGTRQVGYFWSAALGWPLVWDQDEETAIQSPRGGTKITWSGPPLPPRLGKDRQHFDLAASPGADRAAGIARLVSLGATPVDAGVLADPDGNEFCVTAGG
ncbi:MAG TPA: VOC family protein [Nocardioides sp.]|nr:VOC family protein [Nocardioides sp.]